MRQFQLEARTTASPATATAPPATSAALLMSIWKVLGQFLIILGRIEFYRF